MDSQMIEKVYRNSEGRVINIGDWDFMISLDENEQEIINNPLPAGATFNDEPVVYLEDGGLAAKNP